MRYKIDKNQYHRGKFIGTTGPVTTPPNQNLDYYNSKKILPEDVSRFEAGPNHTKYGVAVTPYASKKDDSFCSVM